MIKPWKVIAVLSPTNRKVLAKHTLRSGADSDCCAFRKFLPTTAHVFVMWDDETTPTDSV